MPTKLLPLIIMILLSTFNLSLADSPAAATPTPYLSLPAAHGFDLKRLVGIDWYEIIFFSNIMTKLDACDRYVFTARKDGSIITQYAYHEPGIKGDLQKRTFILRAICEGIYSPIGGTEDQRIFALDYDKDYDWVILVDTYNYGGYVTVLSRTPRNLAAIQRGVDLAEKYGYSSHSLVLHDAKKCDYDNMLAILRRDRKKL